MLIFILKIAWIFKMSSISTHLRCIITCRKDPEKSLSLLLKFIQLQNLDNLQGSQYDN